MFKYLSFFLLALVAVQAVPQTDVHPNEVENYDISDIFETIQQFINQAKDAFINITADIEEALKSIKEKIENEIKVDSVNDIMQKIIEAIKKLVGMMGPVKECIEKERPRIKAIAEEAREGAMACRNAAKAKFEELRPKAEELRQQLRKVHSEFMMAVRSCIKSGGGAQEIRKCVKGAWEDFKVASKPIMEQGKELRAQLMDIAREARECLNLVRKDSAGKMKEVIADIKACIKG